MNMEMNRRDFMRVAGFSAAGIGAWTGFASKSYAALGGSLAGTGVQVGRPLRVKPALVYELPRRKDAWSWRNWGGIQKQNDVEREAERIGQELNDLASSADFPVEVLPLTLVTNPAQAATTAKANCDVILVYAAGGFNMNRLDILANSGKENIMFVRHKSGPVYLWYETAHPIYLRRHTNECKLTGMDVWDVVVDDYGEVLWRLRALYGLTNTLGTRIVAIGDAGGWGPAGKSAPDEAKKIWKLDIRPVTYKELEPMIKGIRADKAAVQQAEDRTDEYLAQAGVSLKIDRKPVVNAFLLTEIFKKLMTEANAPAITIQHCMGTIMAMAQTTACLPLSLLNDEGVMAFCESDFVVIPSGILLRYICGKPVFLNDPTYPHDGIVTCAHCTAPRKMNGKDYEPAKILTHFESDYGAAPKVEFKKGQMTTNLVPSFGSTNWLGFRGKVIDHPFYDICRSQMDLDIEGDWRKLLEDMQGFHWMTCYGDYLREVGYALKKVGIPWYNITTGRTT